MLNSGSLGSPWITERVIPDPSRPRRQTPSIRTSPVALPAELELSLGLDKVGQSRRILQRLLDQDTKQFNHRHIELGGSNLQSPMEIRRNVEREPLDPSLGKSVRRDHRGMVHLSLFTCFCVSVCNDRGVLRNRLALQALSTVSPIGEGPPMQLTVGGRILRATAAFQSYWKLAAERQRDFLPPAAGRTAPVDRRPGPVDPSVHQRLPSVGPSQPVLDQRRDLRRPGRRALNGPSSAAVQDLQSDRNVEAH